MSEVTDKPKPLDVALTTLIDLAQHSPDEAVRLAAATQLLQFA